MRNQKTKHLFIAVCSLAAFFLWTIALCFIDVQVIGPRESTVGFAALNQFIHQLTGVHMTLYTITDWLGLVPVFFALGFAGNTFVRSMPISLFSADSIWL